MTKLPNVINIMGIPYKIKYEDNLALVDIDRDTSLWGQIDYQHTEIRVYKDDRPIEHIWITLMHEICHGIMSNLGIGSEPKDTECSIQAWSTVIMDTLIRNNLITIED
jgi:hypothetical protein